MTQPVVECCDPRDRADQIKDLFARNGQPGFDAVFERAYRPRAEAGLKSWVGWIGDRAVMHISVASQRFGDGSRALTGGLLGDLMVDEAHRDFWAPLLMLRSMVSDVRREGRIDFLLTTMTRASESLFKAGGFRPFGQLRRYVFPLMRPYLAFARLRSGARSGRDSEVPLDDAQMAARLPLLASSGFWRAEARPEFYATRIPRGDYADGTWVGVGGERDRARQAWALLCRHGTWPEVTLADAFWGRDTGGLPDVVLAAARWARAKRFGRLSISTLDASQASRDLKRAGFLARPSVADVLLLQLGKSAPPPVDNWFLTAFVGSSW